MLPTFIRTLSGASGARCIDEDEDADDEEDVAPEKVGEGISVIKRGNRFLAVYAPTLTFLDMSNYLAPGCSYAK